MTTSKRVNTEINNIIFKNKTVKEKIKRSTYIEVVSPPLVLILLCVLITSFIF